MEWFSWLGFSITFWWFISSSRRYFCRDGCFIGCHCHMTRNDAVSKTVLQSRHKKMNNCDPFGPWSLTAAVDTSGCSRDQLLSANVKCEQYTKWNTPITLRLSILKHNTSQYYLTANACSFTFRSVPLTHEPSSRINKGTSLYLYGLFAVRSLNGNARWLNVSFLKTSIGCNTFQT